MHTFSSKIFLSFFLLILMYNCNGQELNNSIPMKNRMAYVAGKFYPADKKELTTDLKKMFLDAKPKTVSNVIALISPHAGYVFSGTIAASAFNQIDSSQKFETIFILASSHTTSFEGASVYCDGNYDTPLGEVKVNTELALKLVKENGDIFRNFAPPHLTEHSIEVQLPFLQYKLGKEIKILPIILGTDNPPIVKKSQKF